VSILLASLAALGTARKGLGAGVYDESQNDSWTNYDEPAAQPVDSWSNYVPFAPDPPDTWFPSPPSIVETPQERKIEEDFMHGAQGLPAPSQSDPSDSSDHHNANNNASNTSPNDAPTPTSSPSRPSRYEREEELQQHPPVIKTVEDAEKKAQADADAALARYMARHDEALEQQDRTVTNEEYYAALQRLKEIEERERALEQLAQDSGLHESSDEEKRKLAEALQKQATEAFKIQSSGIAGIKTVTSGMSLVNPEQFDGYGKPKPTLEAIIRAARPGEIINDPPSRPLSLGEILSGIREVVDPFTASPGILTGEPIGTLRTVADSIRAFGMADPRYKLLADFTASSVEYGVPPLATVYAFSYDQVTRSGSFYEALPLDQKWKDVSKKWEEAPTITKAGIVLTVFAITVVAVALLVPK